MMTRRSGGLSSMGGMAIGVSMVVGTGLLSLTGMAHDIAGGRGSIVGWLLAAAVITPFLVIFAAMGQRFREASGLPACASSAFGEWAGRGLTIVMLSNLVLVLPTVALVGSIYLQRVLDLPERATPLLALGILFLATGFNLCGPRRTGCVSGIALAMLMGLLATLVVSYPHFIVAGAKALFVADASAQPLDIATLWKVAGLVVFAYLGWENLSLLSGEFANPRRTIPRSYGLSFGFVVGLYVALALLVAGANASGVPVTGASGMAVLFHHLPFGKTLCLAVGVISLANTTAWIYGASRSVVAASHKGYLPPVFARLSARGVPTEALLANFALNALVIVSCYAFENLLSALFLLVTQGFLLVYMVSIAAYWKTGRGIACTLVTLLAMASCIFLLTGFHWFVVYPLMVFVTGACWPRNNLHAETMHPAILH